ncbi:right-handed parallel beta-helix repeat-containing protein [Corynebacterium sp. H78]|uniref:right-handed parallel beta-helix repeat-containing protein n=1 Tax=Corynebacterium sp. H78 TaxID=3133417 RepID=UPI0030B67314
MRSSILRIAIAGAIIAALFAAGNYVFKQYYSPLTLFVSAEGSAHGDGSSPKAALSSLSDVPREKIRPGTKIVLLGQGIDGMLNLSELKGTKEDPIVVTSGEDERASITVAPGKAGIAIQDSSHISISNIDIKANPTNPTDSEGIWIKAERTDVPNEDIRIDDVRVSKLKHGILVSGDGEAGFTDVTIRNSVLSDNRMQGILFHNAVPDSPHFSHKNVLIDGVQVTGTTGDATAEANSGSGIVLGNVDGGVIQRSLAENNGAYSSATEGPIGMWAYRSNNIAIRDNISRDNKTKEADGGGFGLDLGVTNSILERNVSKDNMGPGYLIFANDGQKSSRNIVRFNASVNDTRWGNYHGQISIRGGLNDGGPLSEINDLLVTNNSIISSPSTSGQSISIAADVSNARIFRNYFEMTAPGPVVKLSELNNPTGARFCGNAYFTGDSTNAVESIGTSFTTFPEWWSASPTDTGSFESIAPAKGASAKVADLHFDPSTQAVTQNSPAAVCGDEFDATATDLAGQKVGNQPFVGAVRPSV